MTGAERASTDCEGPRGSTAASNLREVHCMLAELRGELQTLSPRRASKWVDCTIKLIAPLLVLFVVWLLTLRSAVEVHGTRLDDLDTHMFTRADGLALAETIRREIRTDYPPWLYESVKRIDKNMSAIDARLADLRERVVRVETAVSK